MLIANKTESAMQVSLIGEIMNENEWAPSDAVYLRAALDAAGGQPLAVWISSPGGSLDAALAMRAMLAAYEGPVSIHTAGIVASAATLLLCVPGAEVVAERGSVFMVHQARMGASGDSAEMRKAADVLDACDDEIADVYEIRMKCGRDKLRDMMAAETWLRSSEALALGLVDKIADATSGGYVAEPRNPDPLPEAVSARLSPRMDAICSSMANITAASETRAQALFGAVERAVSAITDASGKTVTGILDASERAASAIAAQFDTLRGELDKTRAAYDAQVSACNSLEEKYKRLDKVLSDAIGLFGGDPSVYIHDGQRKQDFKLNI